MRVLLTGGSGFLGSHVSEELVRRGHVVRALVRRSSKVKDLEVLGAEIAFGVLEKGEGLDVALRDCDAVIHCAGVTKALDEDGFFEVNERATRKLVDAARREKTVKRFVYVSSLEAFGPAPDGVLPDESMEPQPITFYGKSKLGGEHAVLAAKDDLEVVVLRPTGIYGPRDTEIFKLFQIADRGVMPMLNDKESTFTMVYGPDCANACIDAATQPLTSGAVYFVTDGRVYRWGEAARWLEDALGKKLWLKFRIPKPLVFAVALGGELTMKVTGKAQIVTREKVGILMARHLVASSEAIRKELGWSPRVEFPEGMRLTVGWYREHGWL